MNLRYNYSSRCVIRQDATLRVDQIKLPYVCLVKVMQQQIINVLVRNYNITPSEAYSWWSAALAEKDERIAQILDNFISASENGLPFLINRNPTINYGSIQQCYCVGWTDTLTMSVSLQSLKPLAADFDGRRKEKYYYNSIKYIAVVKAIELLETVISYRATI